MNKVTVGKFHMKCENMYTLVCFFLVLPCSVFHLLFYLLFPWQVVSFLHTVLLCDKLNFRTALVVCPLNTALNWLNEFEKWQEGLEDDEKLEVF